MDPTRATELTSLEAYREIDPTLAERERTVLVGLGRYHQRRGAWPTAYELYEFMREFAIGHVQDLNSVRPRLTALKAQELVSNGPGKRRCQVTGKRALTWQLPGQGRLF